VGKVGEFFDDQSRFWLALFTVLAFLFFVEIMKKGFSPHTIFYLLVAFSIGAATFV
jgi:hypothetical protein